MNEKNPNIIFYLDDLSNLLSKLLPLLDGFVSASQTDMSKAILNSVELIREISMICWMGGNQLQIEFIQDYNSAVSFLIDLLIKEEVPNQIKIELLKLFEIVIRANLTATKELMSNSNTLRDNLEFLFNQNSQREFDQQIRRWILKLLYIYQIHKSEINNWQEINFLQYRKVYTDLYGS